MIFRLSIKSSRLIGFLPTKKGIKIRNGTPGGNLPQMQNGVAYNKGRQKEDLLGTANRQLKAILVWNKTA